MRRFSHDHLLCLVFGLLPCPAPTSYLQPPVVTSIIFNSQEPCFIEPRGISGMENHNAMVKDRNSNSWPQILSLSSISYLKLQEADFLYDFLHLILYEFIMAKRDNCQLVFLCQVVACTRLIQLQTICYNKKKEDSKRLLFSILAEHIQLVSLLPRLQAGKHSGKIQGAHRCNFLSDDPSKKFQLKYFHPRLKSQIS